MTTARFQVTLTDKQKGDYGNCLGIRTKDLNQTFANPAARNDFFTSYVQRAAAWAATHSHQERMATGRILETLETLDPPVFLETDDNRQTGVPLKAAYEVINGLTRTKWYVLEPLVRPDAPIWLDTCKPYIHYSSLKVHMQIYKYNQNAPDVFAWDEKLAESVLIDLAAAHNDELPKFLQDRLRRQQNGQSASAVKTEEATELDPSQIPITPIVCPNLHVSTNRTAIRTQHHTRVVGVQKTTIKAPARNNKSK